VVPGSQAGQGAPIEEQQQEEDHDIDNEDEDDEKYCPLSDNEGEKLYRMLTKGNPSVLKSQTLPTGFVP
jgi:hypothetical protein